MSGHIDLGNLVLSSGYHRRRGDGVCLMEAVAWWADEPHTDLPACVSPVLSRFGSVLNDVLPHDLRQQLKPLIPLLPGTVTDGGDENRRYLALDWQVRTFTPTWFDLIGLIGEAASLRNLSPITDPAAARAAGLVARQASDAAYDISNIYAITDAWASMVARQTSNAARVISNVYAMLDAWATMTPVENAANAMRAVTVIALNSAIMGTIASNNVFQKALPSVSLAIDVTGYPMPGFLTPVKHALQESAIALFWQMITGSSSWEFRPAGQENS